MRLLLVALVATCTLALRSAQYQVGSFVVTWDAVDGLSVASEENPERKIWASIAATDFLAATLYEGLPSEIEGMFPISYRPLCRFEGPKLSVQSSSLAALVLQGAFTRANGSDCSLAGSAPLGISITLSPCADITKQLCIVARVTPSTTPPLQTLAVTVVGVSSPTDRVHGFGVQYSVWDFKGRRVPILVSEQGVGRGLEPITSTMNARNNGGGSWNTTYYPVPHYITSTNKSLALENTEYGLFDLSASDRIGVEVSACVRVRVSAYVCVRL
jgi:sulfoquinovosidase